MHREEYQDKRMIMAKYSRLTVATQMYETGMAPVFYHKDLEVAKKVLKACYDGGVRVFEFTNRGDFAHEVFGELNKFALQELPNMILGAGSVVDSPTAALYIQLNKSSFVGSLIVSNLGGLIINNS
jgi:2-dehydro-3-deoxyphosphogluconate aldolase/(4S)-4-hydroxy-2-oxoglutarate aldolase